MQIKLNGKKMNKDELSKKVSRLINLYKSLVKYMYK